MKAGPPKNDVMRRYCLWQGENALKHSTQHIQQAGEGPPLVGVLNSLHMAQVVRVLTTIYMSPASFACREARLFHEALEAMEGPSWKESNFYQRFPSLPRLNESQKKNESQKEEPQERRSAGQFGPHLPHLNVVCRNILRMVALACHLNC